MVPLSRMLLHMRLSRQLIFRHCADLQDVNVVRAFVMGLIASYGFSEGGKAAGSQADQVASQPGAINGTLSLSSDRRRRQETAGGASQSGDGASGPQLRPGPVEALRPFLMEHAERFWHELRCGCCLSHRLATSAACEVRCFAIWNPSWSCLRTLCVAPGCWLSRANTVHSHGSDTVPVPCRCFAGAPYSMATYDRLVQYTRAEHLTHLPDASAAAATDSSRRPAEGGDSCRTSGVAGRHRETRWDVKERARPEPRSTVYIDLTEQTPPPQILSDSGSEQAAAALHSDAVMPSMPTDVDSMRGSRLRASGAAGTDQPRHDSRNDADERSSRRNTSSRSQSHRRKRRHDGDSPVRRSRHWDSQRRSESCSRSRAGSPRRDRSSGRRRSTQLCVVQHGTQQLAKSIEGQHRLLRPDSAQQRQRAGAVHELAATELRLLRSRALLAMPGAQLGAGSAEHADLDDRWAME